FHAAELADTYGTDKTDDPTTVSGRTMERAIVLAEWFRRETARLYQRYELREAALDEVELVAASLRDEFRQKDIEELGKRLGFKGRKAYSILTAMKERGFAEEAFGERGLYVNMYDEGQSK